MPAIRKIDRPHSPGTNDSHTADPLRALPRDVQRLLSKDGFFGLGESYIRGEWESDALDDFLYKLAISEEGRRRRLRGRMLGYALREKLRNPQVGQGAFVVAERHYDLGNDFFAGMLDSTMSYTCGMWANAQTLDDAQTAKLELLCQKLKLAPGMTVLDIGCGWGNFAEHAARNYGVSVVGLTVSKEQAAFAIERCKGLPVQILLQDYQTFEGSFDRVVSIEMIEAVGRRNIPTFFEMVTRSLKPGGLFALQVISGETFTNYSSPALDQYVVWLLRHIFPNGYLPKMSELTAPVKNGLVIEDMHNFVGDYERTLTAWEDNFEASWAKHSSAFGEEFRRMWRYYLNGCRAMFRARLVQLYQVVYLKP